MTTFVHTDFPVQHPGVVRAEHAVESFKQATQSFDGARGVASLLLAALVSALVVVANQVIETWSDGHLLAAWIALWLVAFAGIALLPLLFVQVFLGVLFHRLFRTGITGDLARFQPGLGGFELGDDVGLGMAIPGQHVDGNRGLRTGCAANKKTGRHCRHRCGGTGGLQKSPTTEGFVFVVHGVVSLCDVSHRAIRKTGPCWR